MTTHPWAANVIGGVGAPRAVLCSGYNLILNDSFEDNLVGWTNIAANIYRYADVTAPHGNYCLKVSDLSSLTYSRAQYTVSFVNNPLINITNCSGKKFILTFYAKEGTPDVGSHNTSVIIADTQNINSQTQVFQVTTLGWKRVAVVLECDYGNVATGLNIELGSTENLFEEGSTLYDKVELYLVDNDYYFEIPEMFTMNYEKVMNYARETWDGTIRSSIKGYRLNAELNYTFLEAAQLQAWIEVSESTFCLFYPHSDHTFATRVEWDGDFPYQYFKNKYLGHELTVKLRGIELHTNKPSQIGSGVGQTRVATTEYVII